MPNNVNIFGMSHNVMILSAASLIELKKLDSYNGLITIKGCNGIRFDTFNGKIMRCSKIKF